jgi:hypothetical protein
MGYAAMHFKNPFASLVTVPISFGVLIWQNANMLASSFTSLLEQGIVVSSDDFGTWECLQERVNGGDKISLDAPTKNHKKKRKKRGEAR